MKLNSKIIGSAPILMVHDVISTAHFYRDKLGFNYHQFWGEPPGFCILHRDAYSIMINRIDKNLTFTPNDQLCKDYWDIYFWTNDVKALKSEFESSGIELFRPLTEKGYGVLEFEIKDNNGYILAFGEELP